MKIRFTALSHALAKLSVADDSERECFSLTEGLGRLTSFSPRWAGSFVHELGFPGAPLFVIERQPSPDEPWVIAPQAGGRTIAQPSGMEPESFPGPETSTSRDESGIREVAAWLPSSSRASGLSLISHLPDGDYFLVRHHNPALDDSVVLLGNEYVQGAGDHLRVLLDSDDAYVGVVGNQRGQMPDLTHPLLGVSVLNYTGDPIPHAALLFCCFDAPAEAVHHVDEVLVVIPRTGPLVFDNMEHFSVEDSREDKKRWADRQAEAFASRLVARA